MGARPEEEEPTGHAVVAEIRRRAKDGRSLGSGANRGDWLYARAVYHFGSWGEAVAAAGYEYRKIVRRPLTKADVSRELHALVASGAPLRAGEHPRLAAAARRLFGGWAEACRAAGAEDANAHRWTKSAVIAAIREDVAAGLPVTANQVRRRNENLYMAGRRRFATWNGARPRARFLAAASVRAEPELAGDAREPAPDQARILRMRTSGRGCPTCVVW